MKKIIVILALIILAGGAFYLSRTLSEYNPYCYKNNKATNKYLRQALLFHCKVRGLFLQRSLVSENRGRSVSINGHKFTVEIADDAKERAKGLGEREKLCDFCGMLFEFSEKEKYSFWMKGMKFPLDIIWISDDRIVYVTKNISSSFKGSINPGIEANRVLEINAGLADEYGIKEGDRIYY